MKPFSIIIPIYNEEKILRHSLTSLENELRKQQLGKYEILLIENGSTDATYKIATKYKAHNANVRIIRIARANFGLAVIRGLKRAKFNTCYLFNIDWWNVSFIKQSRPMLSNFSIIIGSKSLNPSLDKRPLLRKTGSWLLTFILRVAFGFYGSDSHGIKAINKQAILPILSQCTSVEILESELLIRAQRRHVPIVEIPLAIAEVRPARIGFFKRSFRVSSELLRLFLTFHHT